MPQGIPFSTPGEKEYNNIAFTTLWDNYPTSINIPLNGKASKAYFLIAASTYYMQSHIVNGEIKLDLPLNPVKELKSLSLETTANEVVIGLMGVTLVK